MKNDLPKILSRLNLDAIVGSTSVYAQHRLNAMSFLLAPQPHFVSTESFNWIIHACVTTKKHWKERLKRRNVVEIFHLDLMLQTVKIINFDL